MLLRKFRQLFFRRRSSFVFGFAISVLILMQWWRKTEHEVDILRRLEPHQDEIQSTAVPVPVVTTPTPVGRPGDVEKYVTVQNGFINDRGLGNQIFNLAVIFYAAQLSGRRPAMLKYDFQTTVEKVFDLSLERFSDLCPCYLFMEEKYATYDTRIEDLTRPDNPETRNKSIVLFGYYQTWKYTRSIGQRLRNQLRFRAEVQDAAAKFFESHIPPSWRPGFVRVGIHVRRGDVLRPDKIAFGHGTPNETYFERAMKYFTSRYERVQFVVVTNDLSWSTEHITQGSHDKQMVNVTYSDKESVGVDFDILSTCDHVIISTGSFGWWAAWLAHGTAVYYKNWPIANTTFWTHVKYEDYWPPHWIPME